MSPTYQLEKIVSTEDDFNIELTDSYIVFILTGAVFYGVNAFLQRYENQKASANDIDPWRWRKIVVSWIHGFIIGVWSFVGLLCYPELLDDPLLFVNTSSYMLILVSTGYFFYDALDIIVNSRIQEKIGVFLHHVVVIAAFGYILHVKLCVGYSQITLLAEFNNITNSTQIGPVVSPEPNSSKIDEVTVAADEQPTVDTDQHTNENSTLSRTEEMLKDSTSALKSANEAMSAMSSMVVGLLANKDSSSSSCNSLSNPKSNFDFASAYQATYGNNTQISSANAEQTFHRQVDTSKGIVFAEDLPKLDYVSTSLRKQILEDVPERSSGSRCTSHDLSALLTRNVELTNSDKVTFHLKASKTDPFREGVDIHLFASGASVCPVLSLERYMEFRNRKFKDSKTQDAFFVMENRKALTRNYFISSLKKILAVLGYNSDLYNGHSFRIGASTTAGSKIEDHLIQTLGRWSSQCYTRYIRTSLSTIQQAQQALVE
ncbi:unnamed protein product [Mytilus coruscus]|uniref:TLC domain-containing protein n=1 Tax=Mytilus coruscus TaxID=42192 RepID=A0A6J8EPL8_MYTCO|nr:unnamed protein product [Mytilus coruscus]